MTHLEEVDKSLLAAREELRAAQSTLAAAIATLQTTLLTGDETAIATAEAAKAMAQQGCERCDLKVRAWEAHRPIAHRHDVLDGIPGRIKELEEMGQQLRNAYGQLETFWTKFCGAVTQVENSQRECSRMAVLLAELELDAAEHGVDVTLPVIPCFPARVSTPIPGQQLSHPATILALRVKKIQFAAEPELPLPLKDKLRVVRGKKKAA
jgi:hypothetical protein